MKKPQRVRVYEYMVNNGGITHMESFLKLGICNLPGRIYDLRQAGVKIDKEHIVNKQEGNRIEYDRYFVASDNQNVPTY